MKLITGKNLSAVLFAATLAFALAGFNEVSANSCEAACNKFADCVSAQHGGASAKQRATLKGGCMKTCKNNKAQTIACYNKAQNSCTALWNCVQANYKR